MRIRARTQGHNLPKVDQHLTAVFVVLDVNVPLLGSILLRNISYVSSEQFSAISLIHMFCRVMEVYLR